MITNDLSKEYKIESVIAKGSSNDLILDNINSYIKFDGFTIPAYNILFEKYRGIILENCVKITLSDALYDVYRYRPKYLSLKLYGYTDLWHLILWINNMTSMTQFDKKIIYVYDPDALEIIEKIISMEQAQLRENKYNPPVYSSTTNETTTRR